MLSFKGRQRDVWGRYYTELFFMDEPTALSAGHRPCFECRRKDALAFAEAFSGGHRRLSAPAMDKLLQAFADKLEKADVALVFYAGHGLQVNGRNYLVPVDGKLDKESDLVFQAVPLDVIQGLMEQGQRTNIMI